MDNDFFFDRINRVWVNFRKTNHKAPVKIILGQKEKAELEQMASTGDTVKNGKIIYLAQEWIKEKRFLNIELEFSESESEISLK